MSVCLVMAISTTYFLDDVSSQVFLEASRPQSCSMAPAFLSTCSFLVVLVCNPSQIHGVLSSQEAVDIDGTTF